MTLAADMNWFAVLAHHAIRSPDKAITVFEGEPTTYAEMAGRAAALAGGLSERDIALAIYPCVNPSGFEAHTRYNVTGEHPNNDFLRYETTPGTWRGELRDGEGFLRVGRSMPRMKISANGFATSRAVSRPPGFSHRYV